VQCLTTPPPPPFLLTISYVPCVSSQALPVCCRMFVFTILYALCVFPPRHYHYTAVYFCSLFTMPHLCFFLGTTTTLQCISPHYLLGPLCVSS
jgi:hypothetical protein